MQNEVKKNKRGKPTLFKMEIFAEVEKLARVFCASDESIAACLGVHPDTFRRWKRKHDDLCGIIEKGKLHAKKLVQEALFRNAVERNNLSAQIFMLTNLWPDEWRDRRAIVNTPSSTE